jgi:phosphopantothenoylcysteine decarboxylase/phosphopantothenate--cysteine ligase
MSTTNLTGRKLLIVVTGGVAAYKSAMLVSRLAQAGAVVQTIMTPAAEKFLGPATLVALSGRPVARDMFDPAWPLGAHIELARETDLMCVAPATADYLAKTAHGVADCLATTAYLSFTGPVLMAPAMNVEMWEKAAVQRNVEQLRCDGVELIGPDSGWLSCRVQGSGRMSEPEQIVEAIAAKLGS